MIIRFFSFRNCFHKISSDVCIAAASFELFQLVVSGIAIHHKVGSGCSIMEKFCRSIPISCGMILKEDNGRFSILPGTKQPYIRFGLGTPPFLFQNLNGCFICCYEPALIQKPSKIINQRFKIIFSAINSPVCHGPATVLHPKLIQEIFFLPVIRKGIDKFCVHDMGCQTG